MKKKFLAFGLAAAMVLGSAFSVFAGTTPSVDITGGLGSANTGDEAVTGNFDVTYTFHNASHDSTVNYTNFAIEVFGTGFGITCRADAFAVGYNGAESVLGGWANNPIAPTTTWEYNGVDWKVFKEVMADADVTANIKRTGNVLTFDLSMVSGSKSVHLVGTTPEVTMPDALSIHVTGEKVALTNVSFTDNNEEDPEEDPTDPAEEDPTEDPAGEDPTASDSANGASGAETGNKPGTGNENPTNPGTGNENPTKPDAGNENPTKPGLGGPGDGEEQTTPSPNGGNEETVITVTAEAAKAVAAAAVVTSNDGKVLDVELVVTPVDATVAAAVAGMVEADEALSKAGVKALAVLDLELMVGEKKVTLLDNKINVTIPMDKIFKDIAADDVIAVYRVDNDALSFLGTSPVAADKTIRFATEHFSKYVFVVVDNADALNVVKVVEYVKDIDTTAKPDISVADIPVKANASVEDPNKTGDTTPVMPLVVLAVIALGGVLAVVASKKRA